MKLTVCIKPTVIETEQYPIFVTKYGIGTVGNAFGQYQVNDGKPRYGHMFLLPKQMQEYLDWLKKYMIEVSTNGFPEQKITFTPTGNTPNEEIIETVRAHTGTIKSMAVDKEKYLRLLQERDLKYPKGKNTPNFIIEAEPVVSEMHCPTPYIIRYGILKGGKIFGLFRMNGVVLYCDIPVTDKIIANYLQWLDKYMVRVGTENFPNQILAYTPSGMTVSRFWKTPTGFFMDHEKDPLIGKSEFLKNLHERGLGLTIIGRYEQ